MGEETPPFFLPIVFFFLFLILNQDIDLLQEVDLRCVLILISVIEEEEDDR